MNRNLREEAGGIAMSAKKLRTSTALIILLSVFTFTGMIEQFL